MSQVPSVSVAERSPLLPIPLSAALDSEGKNSDRWMLLHAGWRPLEPEALTLFHLTTKAFWAGLTVG